MEASVHGTKAGGMENCLYLNVYVPNVGNLSRTKLPVMVWFHGGDWTFGSGGYKFYGPQYLLDKDIILVAGNYRLNIFGFLSSETLDCPGNFGLKDSVAILEWVNKHIASFGGDPKSVTLFGESSGSVSVLYLMQSKKSNKLFHRAIAQSGTYFNPFGQPHKKGSAAAKALKLARWLNCQGDGNNWTAIIECLRSIPGENLIGQFHKFYDWEMFPLVPLRAVIEDYHKDAFLTHNPLKHGRPERIPLMIGFNSAEGAVYSVLLLSSEYLKSEVKSNYSSLFPLMLNYNDEETFRQNQITEAIQGFYLKNGQDYDLINFENFTQVMLSNFSNINCKEQTFCRYFPMGYFS